MRFSIFDGIRGHLLIGMMIAHLGFRDGMGDLLIVHHNTLIRMFDAEFFVTVSGLLVGILTARKASQPRYFMSFVRRRLDIIYQYYLLSAIPILLLTFFAGGVAAPANELLVYLFQIAFFAEGGAYSDILPIYFYSFLILAASYPIARWFGFGGMVLASLAIYLASQWFQQAGLFGLSANFVVFNVGAWQFLFVLSFVIGIHHQTAMRWISDLSDAHRLLLVVGCVILFGLFRVSLMDLGQGMSDEFAGAGVRFHLHPFYLIAILAFCAGFAIIMLDPPTVLRPVQRLLDMYFSLKFLRTVGQYSIQMFVLHVYLMAIFTQIAPMLPIDQRWALALSMIAVFIAAPNIYVAMKQRPSPT